MKYVYILIGLAGLVLSTGCKCTNCSVDYNVTQQLENIYLECSDENISDLKEFEAVLNSGGNGLDKSCRTAIGQLDFQEVVKSFDFNLSFELPKPEEDINPLRTAKLPWFGVTQWVSTEGSITLSSAVNSVVWDEVTLRGITSGGESIPVTQFSFENIGVSDIAVSYTTDYSASMLEADLLSLSDYFTAFHTVLPQNLAANVQLFSDEVTPRSNGFVIDKESVLTHLAFDSEYDRGLTALFDAWADALDALDGKNSKVQLNILATDGFENDSEYTDEATLIQKISQSHAFNLVIASGWSEPQRLKTLVGNKGIVIFKYQIDEAVGVAEDIKQFLSRMKRLKVNEDVSGYTALEVLYNGNLKYTIPLP